MRQDYQVSDMPRLFSCNAMHVSSAGNNQIGDFLIKVVSSLANRLTKLNEYQGGLTFVSRGYLSIYLHGEIVSVKERRITW